MPEAVGFCLLLSSRWHCVWPVPLTQHAMGLSRAPPVGCRLPANSTGSILLACALQRLWTDQ